MVDGQERSGVQRSAENSDRTQLQLDHDKWLKDYELTHAYFKFLAEIRFKLLAFVPTLSGVAVALLAKSSDKEVALPLGLLGFVVTLGIIIYELRNTVFYDAAIHRAKWLELLLGLPLCTQQEQVGGLFNERPASKPHSTKHDRTIKLFGITVKHDRGLAIIYGAALGGWVFIIVNSLLTLLPLDALKSVGVTLIAIYAGVVTGGIVISKFHEVDQSKKKPKPTTDMTKLKEQYILRNMR